MAPRQSSRQKSKAKAKANITTEQTTDSPPSGLQGLSKGVKSVKLTNNKSDLDFQNVRKHPDCPAWHTSCDYTVHVADEPPEMSKDKKKRDRKLEWEKSRYPPGISLPIALPASLGDATLIAKYNGFKSEADYISYCDGPLMEIIYAFGKVMQLKFTPSAINSAREDEVQGEDEPERPIPRPIDCITLYANSKECRDMVETICLYCPQPTFIPIFNNTISIDEKNHRDEPCPPAMFLAAAAQVLIFAPSHWDPELKLVQTSDYPRRYPINQGFSPTKTIAGRFSMEDLNRALYLIFTVNNRRGKANLLSGIPTKRTGNTRWMGYHDPSWNSTEMELEGTEIIVDGHTEAQLDAEEMLMDQQDAENNKDQDEDQVNSSDLPAVTGLNFIDLADRITVALSSAPKPKTGLGEKRLTVKADAMPIMSNQRAAQVVKVLRRSHAMVDPPMDDIQKTLTYVDSLIDADKMAEYVTTQAGNENLVAFAREHPDKLDELTKQNNQSFAMEMFMSSLQPNHHFDLDQLCDELGLSRYPAIRLRPANDAIEPFKPHQVYDAYSILQRAESPKRHTFLSNDMGTGKTRIYLLAINLHARRLAKQQQQGNSVTFSPSLVITPVNSLPQTYLEAKSIFPDFTLIVFYGQRSTFIDKGAKVMGTDDLINYLSKLDPTNPKTGKTLVITSYTTLSARFISRNDRLFVFNEEKKAAKNQELGDVESDDSSDEAAEGRRRKKVPIYSLAQVNRKNITYVDDPAKADGNLVWYTRNKPGIKNLKFTFVVCDEAQIAKKHDGSYNNLLRKFKWDIILWTSGTPLSNSLRDLISPLLLMWRALDVDWKPKIGPIGYLPGLYNAQYDPEKENNEFNGMITKGIFHPSFTALDPAVGKLMEAWKEDGSRLWYLHPDLYRAAGSSHYWGSNLSSWVVRPIFQEMHIRRTMRTPLTLPNGEITYPGIDLLPPVISIQEYRFGPRLAMVVREEGFFLASRLFQQPNDDGTIPDSVQAASSQSIEGASAEATLNFGVHRTGILQTFDWRNSVLLSPENDMIRGSKKAIELRVQAMVDPNQPQTKAELERMKKKEAEESPVVVGVDHVQHLVANDPNGGLTWLYNMTRKDENTLAPSDRASMLRWVCAESPLMIRMVELLFLHVNQEKKRVLIYVDTPWIQTVVVNVITVAGFNVLTTRPSTKQSDKDQALQDWNDAYSGAQVFVANINTMSVGVNMHYCCHTGIFISWHINMKINLQCCGRLIRIGQKHQVTWTFLKIADSYHDNIERLAVSKWAPQLSAEIDLPDWISDELREILIYEVIKTYLAQPFNRYSWVVLRDIFGHEFSHHDKRATNLGHIFSIIAKIVLRNLELDQDFWCNNMAFLTLGCWHIVEESDIDFSVKLLQHPDDLDAEFTPLFIEAFKHVEGAIDSDPETQKKHKKLRRMMQDRAKEKSSALVSDNGIHDDGAQEDASDDDESGGPARPKSRKKRSGVTTSNNDDATSTNLDIDSDEEVVEEVVEEEPQLPKVGDKRPADDDANSLTPKRNKV
ncbi:unnamed protein product [Fusarium graminearum]|nr:unnamed protein product [Fusarium graminearum]